MTLGSATYEESNQLIAFEGSKSDTFPSSLKGITVDPTCVKTIIPDKEPPIEEPEPSSTEKEVSSNLVGLLIGAGVVALLTTLAGVSVCVWCCVMKSRHDLKLKHKETVIATRTRQEVTKPNFEDDRV